MAIDAILGHYIFGAVAPLVSVPVIVILGLGLAPGKRVADLTGAVGTDIPRRPQCTTGQAQVNVILLGIGGCIGKSMYRDDLLATIECRALDSHVAVELA